MAASSAAETLFFCDLHPHVEASIIADCGQFHRLCAKCIDASVSDIDDEAKSGNEEIHQCPVCNQKIRNEEEITKAFLKLGMAKDVHVDPEDAVNLQQQKPHLPLPTELLVELMHFLDMKNLHNVVLVSRLPLALFGEKVRKWNTRNEWVYPTIGYDEARKRFEISQHGLSVCKGNENSVADILARTPFKLAESTTIHRFYFEIRVNKTTGPILFGLVERNFNVSPVWKIRMEACVRHAESRVQRRPELHREYFHKNRFMWHPCFLANDIAAWPPIDWGWNHGLYFFARQSLVPAVATGDGKFADGDVLGCGQLVFPCKPPTQERPMNYRHQLFFTRNGERFGEPIWVSPANELFPFVCLASAGTSVSANFGEFNKVPFAYNIGQHKSPIGTE